MVAHEQGGPAKAEGAAKAAASNTVTLASGLVVPGAAVQRSPFPRLQVFRARAELRPHKDKTKPDVCVGYQLAFGVQIGLATGRQFDLFLPFNCPGRHMAALLRKMADNLDALVDDIEQAANDPRNEVAGTAGKGPEPVPAALCAVCTRRGVPAPGACLRADCPHVAPGGDA